MHPILIPLVWLLALISLVLHVVQVVLPTFVALVVLKLVFAWVGMNNTVQRLVQFNTIFVNWQ